MTQLVLLSHGDAAGALRDAAFAILGPRAGVHALALRDEEGAAALEAALNALLDRNADEPAILLCDIAGGTPANIALRRWLRYPAATHILCGLNLPMVLAWMQAPPEAVPTQALLQAGRDGIVDISARARGLLTRPAADDAAG